ncbi:hypothetical protein PVAP13_7KG186855 [Panicum virgatum]|uniref:Uncharacterized protein n=1 Tax=Panicum virgatum TaxID=38727 RepID=A0A8T0QIZ1_PANVG|nr:hypothetical protein PVAP13_7KG186855 [Panicum virgatum]
MGCGRAGTRAARAKWRSEGARRGLGARAGEAGRRRRGWRGALRARLRRVGVAERQGSSGGGAMMAGWRACGRCTAGPFGRYGGEAARRRALVAACASTGWPSAARGVCALERGEGVSGARPGSGQRAGQAAAQRGIGRTRGVPERLRAQRGGVSEGERGERKREWRERKESPLFDLAKTRNFQLKLEKF